jgi:L,D-transpeptidase catalytic domain/Bacterial Ig-like domain
VNEGDGKVSFWGKFRRQQSVLMKNRGIAVTAAGGILVVAVGVTVAATTSGSNHETLTSTANAAATAKPARPAAALHLVSVTPSNQAHGVNGANPIQVTFSAKLAADSPVPSLSPPISGSWQVSGDSAVFTPVAGYPEDTHVTVRIPGGAAGVQSAAGQKAGSGGTLANTDTVRFTTRSYSTLRLQQLLAQLGYLPLTWTPAYGNTIAADDANAQLSAAYSPPAGTFTWHSGYPSELTDQWQQGAPNEIDVGAIRAFESNENMTMDGMAGPDVWSHLLKAVARGQDNPNGYTYALVNQNLPESLKVWHNGQLVMDTPANTGIPESPTVDGTFPVYLRFQVTQMIGTNPDGSAYDDTVYWVSYFNGGDALHYFPRGGYGYNQSLGCVELQWDPAKAIYPLTTYGTLVTVIGPVGG